MEFNGKEFGEVLFITYEATLVIAMGAILRIKYLLKKYYTEQHNQLFNKWDISESIRLMSFYLTMKKWEFVQEDKTLAWLKFNRITLLFSFSIIFIAVIRGFVAVFTR